MSSKEPAGLLVALLSPSAESSVPRVFRLIVYLTPFAVFAFTHLQPGWLGAAFSIVAIHVFEGFTRTTKPELREYPFLLWLAVALPLFLSPALATLPS